MQVLYQLDLVPPGDRSVLDRFIAARLSAAPLTRFARSIVDGVQTHHHDLDAAIEQRADNWRLARMTVVDRTLLRIATYEILYTDVPPAVAADEAVELAKRYGAESSPRFVAGILGRLIADRSKPATAATASPS
jgi:N utilization substance protein B